MDTKELIPWNWFKKSDNNSRNEWNREISKSFGDFLNSFDNFENALPRLFKENLLNKRNVLPSVDISENPNEYIIEVDLPGVKEEDIDISISKDRGLKIKGKREHEAERKDNNYYILERSHGSFERTLFLPEECDSESVEASFNNGILTIKIAKKEPKPNEVKKIKVNRG